jgi:hypothetical protein
VAVDAAGTLRLWSVVPNQLEGPTCPGTMEMTEDLTLEGLQFTAGS